MNNQFYKNLSLWIVIILLILSLYNIFNPSLDVNKRAVSITYTDFLNMVDDERINNVVMQDNYLYATDSTGNRFKLYAPNDIDLVKTLRAKKVTIMAKPPEKPSWIASIIASWLPMIILIGIWIFFVRQMQGGGGSKTFSFGRSRAKLMDNNEDKITFKDVAGIEEAKDELIEIVDFLKNPGKYTKLGGRIPKGVLLVGPPGTGKTLLARSIAGEAGVPFFTISGSDFVEMFVGVGASRVRDLFAQAKKNAPCIIFIDELDAVGRHRGAGLGGGHDEREQTLNQLLVEMDGFKTNEGVILIAATNRPDVLDPALLRPGRFDRQVVVDLPDVRGREAILKVHTKKTPIEDDVDFSKLAKGTPGFSGADLENMINEAALIAAKKDREKLTNEDFEDAKDKVYMGLERKSKVFTDEEKKTTAYHESGHAIVARFLPHTDAVNKVTIIPRGRAAGVTWFLPEESTFKYKDQLQSEIAVAMGGRVAEELVFNRISTGASNDIKSATDLAEKMVRLWGMDEEIGPLAYANKDEQVFLGKDISKSKEYSEATAQKIDAAIQKMVKNAYQKAKDVLKKEEKILHKLSEQLLIKETITGFELDEIIYEINPDATLD